MKVNKSTLDNRREFALLQRVFFSSLNVLVLAIGVLLVAPDIGLWLWLPLSGEQYIRVDWFLVALQAIVMLVSGLCHSERTAPGPDRTVVYGLILAAETVVLVSAIVTLDEAYGAKKSPWLDPFLYALAVGCLIAVSSARTAAFGKPADR